MTTETETPKETKKAKKPANLYIFEGDGDQRKIVGSIYFHGKGTGQNLLLNGKRYTAFAPKPKAAPAPAATEGKGA